LPHETGRFIYVLEGEVTLVTDAGRQKLKPVWRPDFPPARRTGHQLVNETRRPAVYLEIGDRTPGDGATYSEADLAAKVVDGKWSSPTRTAALTRDEHPHQERPLDRSEEPGRREAGRFHSGRKNRCPRQGPAGFRAERTINASNLAVCPGLIDLSARLREPGFEYKATLASEMQAAVAGGVTSLACPPDTDRRSMSLAWWKCSSTARKA